MRRPLLVATLSLPVLFAALPAVSLAFLAGQGETATTVSVTADLPRAIPVEGASQSNTQKRGCDGDHAEGDPASF